MPWWAWIVLGVGLLGAEMMVVTDFWLALVGAGALTVGLLASFGLGEPAWLQFALFGVLSITYLVVFRRRLSHVLVPEPDESQHLLSGEFAVTQEEIAPGETGRVELRGSVWQGLNRSHEPLAEGTRCPVEEIDGLVVHIRSEAEHRARRHQNDTS
jgi:membrane protein implicated in regulation of membrane protease activity